MVCEQALDSSPNQAGALRPVLMDFGLARDSMGPQRLTQTGVIMGTPHYMAPEQARGMARQLDRRADVYSLGAMLYELLCGKPPFEAENEVDLLMAVLHQDPIPLRLRDSSIPVDLEIIAHKCLRKEPGQRYDSAQALADDLARYLRGEPIMARPASTLYKLRRLAARHRAPFAVGMVVFVSMLTLLAMWGQARAQRRHAEQQAAEQERLAVQLGQSVTEMKLFLRVAYSLPPHDLRRDKEVVRERLRKLGKQLETSDRFLHGTIESALGQGYLALEEFEPAVGHLQRAIDLGENTTGTHLALGEALTHQYQKLADDIRRQNDPAESQRKLDALGARILPRARQELHLGKEAELASPSYVDALLWRYADPPSPEKAMVAVRKAKEESPWQLEPMALELRILGDQLRTAMLSEQQPDDSALDEAQRTLEQSISAVRSYPLFYELHAEFMTTRLRRYFSDARPVSALDGIYRSGLSYAQTWAKLLPEDGQPLDGLLGIHAALAFTMGWKNIDPRPVVKDALVVLAEAKKRPPERTRTFRGEIAIYHAVARYLEFSDEDSTEELKAALVAARKVAELEPQEAETWAQLALATSLLAMVNHQHGIDARSDLRQAILHQERALKQNPAKLLWFNNLAAYLMFLAELEQAFGDDPTPGRRRATEILRTLLAKNPNFLLAEENDLSVENDNLRYRIETQQVSAELPSPVVAHAEQLLQKYPMTAGVDFQYVSSLVNRGETLLVLKQPALAAIEEAESTVRGPKLTALAAGLRQDKLAQIELLKMRAQIEAGQSPAATLLSLFATIPTQSIQKGGMLLDRQIYRVEAMRRYAEWLMQKGAQPLRAPQLPGSALAAVERALAMIDESSTQKAALDLRRQAEQSILWLLKAKLDPKADVVGLQAKAVQQYQQLAKVRPLLARRVAPYLPASPVVQPAAQ
jgi:serine/threonine-protein kinase